MSLFPFFSSSVDGLRQQAMTAETLFCAITQRFYKSYSSMNAARITEFGFLPSSSSSSSISQSLDRTQVRIADVRTYEILPTLMPSSNMDEKRETIRAYVQEAIRKSGVVPDTTEVALYGSSINNFGNDDAGN